MEQIIFQSVCNHRSECLHVKEGKACEHAKPLRRKEFSTPVRIAEEKEAFEFSCPNDPGLKYKYCFARCSCRKNEYIRWRAICHPSLFAYTKDAERPALRHELSKKFNKCYAIFRRMKRQTTALPPHPLEGYCEASFSMSWDKTRVMPVTLKEAEGVVKESRKMPHNKGYEFLIVRISGAGKNNPVVIDWNASKNAKYAWRNIPFKAKPVVVNTEELMSPVL